MLHHLRAQNLGVIRDAEIDPSPGLTVLTGETGAGKTLLLGALRLLLGESADSNAVGPFGERAQADGVFESDGEIAISRVVPAQGRSRAYLDGVIVSAERLSDEVGAHVEIVGQHDQLLLRRSGHVLQMIDAAIREGGDGDPVGEYDLAWSNLKLKREEQMRLGGSKEELARELDLARYQSSEIEAAGFDVGDDDDLEQRASRLRNSAEIKEALSESDHLLGRINELSGQLVDRLRKISSMDAASDPLREAAETLDITASELTRQLSAAAAEVVDDPEAATIVEERLTLLGNLKMKYGKTVEEILEYGRVVSARAAELATLLERAETIDSETESALADALRKADRLSAERKKTAQRIASRMEGHLGDLGMGEARIQFDFASERPGSRGTDRVELHMSTHENLDPGPIAKIASGGELSRLVLAAALSGKAASGETLVFDEVDAGVGGRTALELGSKLAGLAKNQQVLCVTHLPQLAAHADVHYVIERSDGEARVRRVDDGERLTELSRMIAGLPDSERGQQAAEELLDLAGK